MSAQPLILPSRANAVTQIHDRIRARLAEIRAEQRELAVRFRALASEEARLRGGEIMLGIEDDA